MIHNRKSSQAAVPDLFALALWHHQMGQLEDAERIYRQILNIDPVHPDSLHLLGMVGYQCGHAPAAAELIQQAIALRSDTALYHSNLGVVLNSLGQLDQAIASYEKALSLKPDYVDAHSNIGNCLVARGKAQDAMPHFQQVLAANPKHVHALVNLGVAFAEQGDTSQAKAHYEKAIQIDPKCPEAFSNLGNVLQTCHQLEEAAECYRHSLTLKPDYLDALLNYGNLWQAQNQIDDAIACYDRALAVQPRYSQAIYYKALAQLLSGNFADGWQNYEHRWNTAAHKPLRVYKQARWEGERVNGPLLIWPEQGVGDEIMFAGLIPDVLRRTPACILECDARLRPLFQRSFPGVRVVSESNELPFAAHQAIGSLPKLFRNSLADFALTTSPYLAADQEQRQRFRHRYASGKRLIGLAWNTKNKKTGPGRSMALSLLRPLFEQEGMSWISLQYGEADELEKQAARARAPVLIDREVDQLIDMDTFAAQISALDLVITIDNSTAHLAGALGVPVWVMLPFVRDWRWLQDRTDSPWYPGMRLFRQEKNGDWSSVIESISKELAMAPLDRAAARAFPPVTGR